LEVGRFYECLHFADSVQILNGKYKWKYYLVNTILFVYKYT
jgi:hypothetical protein